MEYNMSNGTQNNGTGWRNKLDELKNLPGETVPENNEMWDRLYQRLTPAKNNKKIKWYLFAAAFLSFALVASIYFTSNAPVKNKSATEQSVAQTPSAVVETPSPRVKNPGVSNATSEKAISISNQKLNRKITGKVVREQSHILRLRDTVSSNNLSSLATNDSIEKVSLSPDLVINNPAKKKLKVVHVNELGDPVEQAPSVAPNVSLHYFRIKFANQQVYTSPPPSNENGSRILKLKTPLN